MGTWRWRSTLYSTTTRACRFGIHYRQVMANTFAQHDFSFKWSYAEMAPLIAGVGYDWAIQQKAKCIKELVALLSPHRKTDNGELFDRDSATTPPPVTITCKSADSLDHIEDGSIDAVVMDPPYYDNVMYAELSDFFYVWLKRTVGHVFPELFRSHLADKDNEAVANPARFQGQKGARALAGRDYQERMAAIFAECHRTLKSDGIMTLMFTHKAAGAWDALTTGLMEAGFAITASWPINTEAPGSMHIKDKAAANSTIFLVCRPRDGATAGRGHGDALLGGHRTPGGHGRAAAGEGLPRGRDRGCGPLPRVFRPRPGGVLAPLAPPAWNAAETARATPSATTDRAVRGEMGSLRRHPGGRPGCRPARGEEVAAGAAGPPESGRGSRSSHGLLRPRVGCLPRADVLLRRGPEAGPRRGRRPRRRRCPPLSGQSGGQTDPLGQFGAGCEGSARPGRRVPRHDRHDSPRGASRPVRSLAAAREMLAGIGVDRSPRFATALEAVLEVLPVPKSVRGFELDKGAKGLESASIDFEVLEGLRRLAFSDRIDEPEQLKLWRDGGA